MSRDDNFNKVIAEAYKDDTFGTKCEFIAHGFMDFLMNLTGASEGELSSSVEEDHMVVQDGELLHTRQYRARVVVKGPNGEAWALLVPASPDH